MKVRDYLILTGWGLLILALIGISMWLWWFADCEVLKAINAYAPGRCIQ